MFLDLEGRLIPNPASAVDLAETLVRIRLGQIGVEEERPFEAKELGRA